MLNSKERSNLLSLANKIDTTVYIGKYGLTEAVLAQIDETLFNHELIKVGVQKNADFTAKECINVLCEKLSAEPVHAIGSKIVIYRRSNKEGIEHVDYTKDAKEIRESARTEKPKTVVKKSNQSLVRGKSYDRKPNSKKAKVSHSPEKKDGITMYKNGKRYGKK